MLDVACQTRDDKGVATADRSQDLQNGARPQACVLCSGQGRWLDTEIPRTNKCLCKGCGKMCGHTWTDVDAKKTELGQRNLDWKLPGGGWKSNIYLDTRRTKFNSVQYLMTRKYRQGVLCGVLHTPAYGVTIANRDQKSPPRGQNHCCRPGPYDSGQNLSRGDHSHVHEGPRRPHMRRDKEALEANNV